VRWRVTCILALVAPAVLLILHFSGAANFGGSHHAHAAEVASLNMQSGDPEDDVIADATDTHGGTDVAKEPGKDISMTLEPSSAELEPRGWQPFTATVSDSKGKPIPNPDLTWQSNGGGNILPTGKTTAIYQAPAAAGFYPSAVTAAYDKDKATASANITVAVDSAVTIVISPPVASMVVNTTRLFTATTYVDDIPIPDAGVTWSALPGSGVIESSGPTTATFRAGTTPGVYTGAVRATNGAVTGTATVDVRAGPPASIVITPTAAVLAINSAQLFTAHVFDQFGNVLPVGVTWLTPAPFAGAIESSSALTVVFRAGTVAGSYPNGLRAANGAAVATAAIAIPPDPPADLVLSATPEAIVTDGLDESTIVVTVTDSFGNAVGAGAVVTLNVDQCGSSCTLGATSMETNAQGQVTTTLHSTNTSITEPVVSTIKVIASITTNSGVVSRPVVVNGSFTPYRSRLPISLNGDLNNHTACTALIVTPPAIVNQRANNAFNIYRFSAAAMSYNVTLERYATTGQLLLYLIVDDRCASTGSMSVNFIRSINITSPATFLTTLSGLQIGQTYLLAVNTTGALTPQMYTLTIEP
jgi:hypothetical protein